MTENYADCSTCSGTGKIKKRYVYPEIPTDNAKIVAQATQSLGGRTFYITMTEKECGACGGTGMSGDTADLKRKG